MSTVKDLIYFDVEKARSIISQLKGGLINEISRAFEDEAELTSGVGVDLKLIKANLGGSNKERSITTERVEVYHELLNEIEKQLGSFDSLTNLNESFDKWEGSFNTFMEEIPKFNYIKATGWGQFEDFERFKKIFSNFNDIQRLIYNSQLMGTPEMQALQTKLNDARRVNKNIGDRNVKAKDAAQIAALQKKVDIMLVEQSDIHLFDDDFIERVKIFMDTFSPHRLSFRLLPLPDFNNFQVLSTLKEKYIVDGSMESIIYTYGSRPNIQLTCLGIVTSAPRESDVRVDPIDEFLMYDEGDLKDTQAFEKAFRTVFSSFEAFEGFFFAPSYPKVSISPIAIYREVPLGPKKKASRRRASPKKK